MIARYRQVSSILTLFMIGTIHAGKSFDFAVFICSPKRWINILFLFISVLSGIYVIWFFLSTYKKIMFTYFRFTTSSSLLLQNHWTFEVALWWRNFKACYVLPERNKTTVCILDNMINRHSKDFKLAIWEISRRHLSIFHIII